MFTSGGLKNVFVFSVSTATVEPKVISEGRLFYCPALDEWFSIETIDADPRLSLMEDQTVAISETAEKENLGH